MYGPYFPSTAFFDKGETVLTFRAVVEVVHKLNHCAISGGKEFATMDASDLMAMHNQELAVVNHARQMADIMSEQKIGSWVKENILLNRTGWEQVGKLHKEKNAAV